MQVPVANVLEDPQVQLKAQVRHLDLISSYSEYHSLESNLMAHLARLVLEDWTEIVQAHGIRHRTKMQTHAMELEITFNPHLRQSVNGKQRKQFVLEKKLYRIRSLCRRHQRRCVHVLYCIVILIA